MKVGNISQTVYKRSIEKQLNKVREEILYQPSKEEHSIAVCIEEGNAMVSAEATTFGTSREIGIYALSRALNDLLAWRATPLAISLSIMLPVKTSEAFLKQMIETMRLICLQEQVSIAEVKTEVNPTLRQVFVSVRAYGQANPNTIIRTSGAVSGQDIVLCGTIGLEGVLRILDEKQVELQERFIPAFLRKAKAHKENLTQFHLGKALADLDITAIHQIGSGGILAALWNLAEASDIGLVVERAKMSIDQETVEICEYYNVNPYSMTSAGSFLIVTQNGEALVDQLAKEGIRASRLGITTKEKARVITSGEEKRYLDRPAPDELMCWWQRMLSE